MRISPPPSTDATRQATAAFRSSSACPLTLACESHGWLRGEASAVGLHIFLSAVHDAAVETSHRVYIHTRIRSTTLQPQSGHLEMLEAERGGLRTRDSQSSTPSYRPHVRQMRLVEGVRTGPDTDTLDAGTVSQTTVESVRMIDMYVRRMADGV